MEASLGAYLKRERESRGVTLAEVAAETRVPVASLQSLEEDRLDELPGDVFVRGFLRAYARCIELDLGGHVRRPQHQQPEECRVAKVHGNQKQAPSTRGWPVEEMIHDGSGCPCQRGQGSRRQNDWSKMPYFRMGVLESD